MVVGGVVGPAGRVFRCKTPDGGAFVVAFHVPRRVWQAKKTGSTVVCEARSLRDAVAGASGDDPDAQWIGTLESEISAAISTSAGQP